MFSQIKDRKHIEQNFHAVAWVMPQGWDLGCWGVVKNLSVEIWDGAPSTVHSSLTCCRGHSGSLVEYLTQDGGAAGSSLTSVTVLCP